MTRRAGLLAAAAAIAAAAGGCGGDGGEEPLRVAAAASLKAALTEYAAGFEGEVSLSFAGSDQLAAQIRQGARPDVFASADVALPRALAAEGLAGPPVAFASNRLVLAVPAGSTRVRSARDLERPGIRIAVAAPGVPAGEYARRALTPAARRNVRSREPDVSGVVGKVAQGAVDAGVVYATDVRASGGRLREVPLPSAPPVTYAATVVRPGARAQAFVDGLRDAPALRRAGFGPP